jgi:primosomal protein N'
MNRTFVDVILFLRLPQHVRGVFSYELPKEFVTQVQKGSFVRVPFRGRDVFGVVTASNITLLDHSFTPQVVRGVFPQHLTETEIHLVMLVASMFRVSPSLVLRSVFSRPPLTGGQPEIRSVVKLDTGSEPEQWMQRFVTSKNDTVALVHTNEQRLRLIRDIARLTVASGKSVLLLTPLRLDLLLLKKYLSGCLSCVVLNRSSGLRASWEVFQRSREEGVIILGTRAAAFQGPSGLGAIIIDHSESDDLKQYEMSPYYDARVVTRSTRDRLHIPRLLISCAPRSVEWSGAARHIDLKGPSKPSRLISLRDHWRSEGRGLLTPEMLDAVSRAVDSGKSVFVLHNRRGRYRRTICEDCGEIILCQTCLVPLMIRGTTFECPKCGTARTPAATCPSCKSIRITQQGMGIEMIASILTKRFSNARIDVCDRDELPSPEAEIIVGTERILSTVAPSWDRSVGLLAVVFAEYAARADDFDTSERIFRSLRRAKFWASSWGCQLLVQAADIAQPAIANLDGSPARFYASEIADRALFRYPPSSRLVRCTALSISPDLAGEVAQLLRSSFRDIFQSLDGPYSFGVVRGSGSDAIIIRCCNDATDHQLAELVETLPKDWGIDVDPIAIRS